jgi:ABC-type multidrug transport system ATPase subunit
VSAATDSPGPALRLRGVRQHYVHGLWPRRVEVLRGVDLELARGRTLGLAGPNGSGKSTLLRVLAGIECHGGGELAVLGGSPRSAVVRRAIGYLPEESPFPPELSVRGALRLLGSLQGMPRRELAAESERLLELVGLREHARTRLSRCSRGMLRRFGLAQAWLHAPELVLLDEPTSGLDAQGYEVLQQLFAEARARGVTIVIASHLIADLEDACDELAVILGGRIALRGAARELLARRSLLELYRSVDPAGSDAIPRR